MILFVSGRCDIPAFYAEWLFHRFEAGYVDVRNPFNPHQISRIPLDEANIDALIFCTKNPLPLLKRIDKIPFPSMYHITITPYHQDIEPNVLDKKTIIQAVKTLSAQVGKERVVVRYDPILLTERYTIEYHKKAFASLAAQLQNDISMIIVSFVDYYKNTKANFKAMQMKNMNQGDMEELAKIIGAIVQQYHIPIQTCGEELDFSLYGIKQGACVSQQLMEQLLNHPYELPKGKPPRNCKCLPFVDIGDYNACAHLCKYCYANYDEKEVHTRMKLHDPYSSVLLGQIEEGDHITIRKEKDHRQFHLF